MTVVRNNGADSGLAARFTALLDRLNLGSHSHDAYRLLEDHYSEPERHYHTLNHVERCLKQLDKVREQLYDADAAELALWFHDAVYHSVADDNELRSAFLFDSYLGIHLPSRRADNVHAMIMATVHPSQTVEPDAQFVADIDLSGLFLPWDAFRRDTDDFRRERRHLTDTEFQLGTVNFFRKLMTGQSIFLTDHFRTRHEEQARRNMVSLIDEMESGGSKVL